MIELSTHTASLYSKDPTSLYTVFTPTYLNSSASILQYYEITIDAVTLVDSPSGAGSPYTTSGCFLPWEELQLYRGLNMCATSIPIGMVCMCMKKRVYAQYYSVCWLSAVYIQLTMPTLSFPSETCGLLVSV